MALIDRLLEATKDIWQAYHEHPFVKGIADGSLDQQKFKHYILQDYIYLLEYAKVFGIGMAKAKSVKTMKYFAHYVHLLTDGEMDIHRGYMGKLQVTQQELDQVTQALDNLSYTSYMIRVAYEEGEAEILAAILSCAYSYEVIAKKIVQDHPDALKNNFYSEWIEGYISEDYHEANLVLIHTLTELTENYTESQIQHLIDIFVACSRYELAFWDLSWEMRH